MGHTRLTVDQRIRRIPFVSTTWVPPQSSLHFLPRLSSGCLIGLASINANCSTEQSYGDRPVYFGWTTHLAVASVKALGINLDEGDNGPHKLPAGDDCV